MPFSANFVSPERREHMSTEAKLDSLPIVTTALPYHIQVYEKQQKQMSEKKMIFVMLS